MNSAQDGICIGGTARTKYFIYADGSVQAVMSLRSGAKRTCILQQRRNNAGYLRVTMRLSDVKQHFFVHRLVAEHFIPNPERLPQVNHIDANKLHNDYRNLESCSSEENLQHARHLGLLCKKPRVLMPTARRILLMEQRNAGASYKELSKLFGISKGYVADIVTGRKQWAVRKLEGNI